VTTDDRDAEPVDYVSSLAFTVRNDVRPLGMKVLGLPCLLNGSGMSLPWMVAADAPLAGGHIGEEYRLAVDLAMRGYPPMYCPSAVVKGPLPKAKETAIHQRRRWTHTHLTTIREQVPRLLANFLTSGRFTSLALAADIVVPPLTLFLLALIVTVLLAVANFVISGSTLPLAIASTCFVAFLATLLLVSAMFSSELFSRRNMSGLPRYFVRHLPHGLDYFRQPHTRWTKTPREQVRELN
jgi:cellulose synthase/poly-beta-1,6-N-acetylglucosamine synthase-like glycosyltransferase